jgi:hypothetical protein
MREFPGAETGMIGAGGGPPDSLVGVVWKGFRGSRSAVQRVEMLASSGVRGDAVGWTTKDSFIRAQAIESGISRSDGAVCWWGEGRKSGRYRGDWTQLDTEKRGLG